MKVLHWKNEIGFGVRGEEFAGVRVRSGCFLQYICRHLGQFCVAGLGLQLIAVRSWTHVALSYVQHNTAGKQIIRGLKKQ